MKYIKHRKVHKTVMSKAMPNVTTIQDTEDDPCLLYSEDPDGPEQSPLSTSLAKGNDYLDFNGNHFFALILLCLNIHTRVQFYLLIFKV